MVTTGEVALANGQDYIGIDLSPDYCKFGEQRMKNVMPSLIVSGTGETNQ